MAACRVPACTLTSTCTTTCKERQDRLVHYAGSFCCQVPVPCSVNMDEESSMVCEDLFVFMLPLIMFLPLGMTQAPLRQLLYNSSQVHTCSCSLEHSYLSLVESCLQGFCQGLAGFDCCSSSTAEWEVLQLLDSFLMQFASALWCAIQEE